MRVSRLSPQLAFMFLLSLSISSLGFVSSKTLQFISILKALIPTLITVEYILYMISSSILSEVRITLDVTVNMKHFVFTPFPKIYE